MYGWNQFNTNTDKRHRTALSEAFSFLFSSLAILEPNCMALFRCKDVFFNPRLYATALSKIFSPNPRSNCIFIFTFIGNEFKKDTTFSSRYGHRPATPWSVTILKNQRDNM